MPKTTPKTSNWWTRFWGAPEPEVTPVEEAPKKEPQQVDMSRFISKPKTIDAVKWDGSPEGAAEVKLVLKKCNMIMDRVNVAYAADGSLDKANTKILYWHNRTGDEDAPRPSEVHDRNMWSEYTLDQGWLVAEKAYGDTYTLRKVSKDEFKRTYFQLDQVTYDDFIEWVRTAS